MGIFLSFYGTILTFVVFFRDFHFYWRNLPLVTSMFNFQELPDFADITQSQHVWITYVSHVVR